MTYAPEERCQHCGKPRRAHRVVFLRTVPDGIAVALECAGSRQRYRARVEPAQPRHRSAVPLLLGTALGGLPGIVFGAVVGMLEDD